jgi:hypothetical protein
MKHSKIKKEQGKQLTKKETFSNKNNGEELILSSSENDEIDKPIKETKNPYKKRADLPTKIDSEMRMHN